MNFKEASVQSLDRSRPEQSREEGYLRGKPIARRMLTSGHTPITLILLFMILVGIWNVTAYGQSWDEYNNYTYGEKSLNSYTNGTFLQDQNEEYFHGTFYFMVFSVTSRLFAEFNSLWDLVDGRHFTNYLTFIGAAFCIYVLALRMMDRFWASATTLIFITQPLYFGHAFINAKDVPFMALFLVSVTAGLFASDLWREEGPGSAPIQMGSRARSLASFGVLKLEWGELSRGRRVGLLLLIVFSVLVAFDLFAQRWIYPGLSHLLARAYEGHASPAINTMFSFFAGQAERFPLEGYLEKLRIAYLWLRIPFAALAFLPAFILIARWLNKTTKNHIRPWLLRYGTWGIAGVFLGLTASIRIFGPFAGALVTLYALYNHRVRALPALVMYWIIQGLTTYLTWPTLWGDPVASLWNRLITASDFDPNFLLFEGQHILSSQLPRTFVLKLMALQYTEPALLLFVIGFFWSVFRLHKNRKKRLFIVLLVLWFYLPVGTQILLQTTVYDNFRHFLFATPPLFLFAGYGLMRIVQAINREWARAPAVLLVVLSGIIPIFQYHPYEYTYFNSLAGGVSGASDRYELDYWCISYREAMAFINSTAPSGASILVLGPDEAAREFAREDLNVVAEAASIFVLESGETVRKFPREDLMIEDAGSGREEIAYVLTCISAMRGVSHHPELPVVYEIRRGEAIFTTVKAVP